MKQAVKTIGVLIVGYYILDLFGVIKKDKKA